MSIVVPPINQIAACHKCSAFPEVQRLDTVGVKHSRSIYRVMCNYCDYCFPIIWHAIESQDLAERAWNAYSTDQRGAEIIKVDNSEGYEPWEFADTWKMQENAKLRLAETDKTIKLSQTSDSYAKGCSTPFWS